MKTHNSVTFLISGGHLTPALAVIDTIREHHPSFRIVFIGREFSQEKEQQRSREAQEMKERKITFYSVIAAKFHRTYIFRNIQEVTRFIPSLLAVVRIVRKEKPDIFLSFGGYLAFPIAVVCKLFGISVVTHEQTRTVGLANQVIGQFADLVLLSFDESRKYFPKGKTKVTGNPIRPALMKYFRAKPEWLTSTLNKPLLYITGGSQGSHVINQTVSNALEKLVKNFIVIHQCGSSSSRAYIEELEQRRLKLSPEMQKRYIPREWVSEEDVAWLFQHAEFVVSRSGANTVQEIVYNKIPAVFIPLPFAHNDEQTKNAQWLVDRGSAYIIPQKDFIPETFVETVLKVHRKIGAMKRRAEELQKYHIEDAAHHIVQACVSMVK